MPASAAKYPITPDGRYLVVDGTLWRTTNPNLPQTQRQQLVAALMDARRDCHKHRQAPQALADARQRVQAAKVALGERGPPWWTDGAPCYNRHRIDRTPYARWYAGLGPPATDEAPRRSR
jgi:predicted exporter